MKPEKRTGSAKRTASKAKGAEPAKPAKTKKLAKSAAAQPEELRKKAAVTKASATKRAATPVAKQSKGKTASPRPSSKLPEPPAKVTKAAKPGKAAKSEAQAAKPAPPAPPKPDKASKKALPAKARTSSKRSRALEAEAASKPAKTLTIPPLLLEGDLPPPQPLSGPGARYALSPEPIVAHSPSMSGGELPETYGTNHLFLAARDPHWLHASWDMSLEQQREFNHASADGHLVLRVFSEGAAKQVTEAHVHPESRSWFVNVPFAEHRYHAELGCYDNKRVWRSIAVSRSTFTPPEAPAAELASDFATIPPEVSFQQIVEVVQEFVSEHQPLLEAVVKAREAEHPAPEAPQGAPQQFSLPATESFVSAVQPPLQAPAPGDLGGWPAHTPETVRAESEATHVAPISEPAPHVTPVESPAILPSGIKPARSFRVELPVRPEFRVRVERRADWTAQQARAVAELISVDSYRRVWLGSLEITELIRRRLQEEISSIAAAQLAREQVEMGAAKEMAAPSSFMGPAPEKDRGFWFKVNAELIIYGSTDPGAKVTVAGRPIKLREDGSFSFRFSLPDGRYRLPAVAISPDGVEGREARLEFSRSTEYHGQVQLHPQDPALRPPHAENVA